MEGYYGSAFAAVVLSGEKTELSLALIAIEDFRIRPFRPLCLFYLVNPSEVGVLKTADKLELP